MRYWIQRGAGQPEELNVDQVVHAFKSSQIGWDTPACEVGAATWTSVGRVPALVAAIHVAEPPQPPVAPSPPPGPLATAATDLRHHADLHREIGRYESYRDQLMAELTAKRSELGELSAQVDVLKVELGSVEEALEVQSFGFYRPKFDFATSEDYARRLDQIRDKQQDLLKADQATRCEKKWVVDGSSKKGAAMARDQSKLMLRAFNGECDAAIAKVKYDNVTSLEKRIKKSLDAINKLGASKHIEIAPDYAALKLDELFLVHEHREKVHEEREAQRAIKEQMKEEQRAEAEIRDALERAQKDESRKQEALERARHELADSTGQQHAKLEQLVSRLENELSEALDRKAKAIARAQLTKSGYVYVLSNVGCFGPDVYKIGMTRRLEPSERVQELGDASVPFQFDVHAMIYAEDAPALEKALHDEFGARRVNLVNLRKEFFRVTLAEVQAAVTKLHGQVTFLTVPEAEEFRKTQAIEEERSRVTED